jgi:hypothetical protein
MGTATPKILNSGGAEAYADVYARGAGCSGGMAIYVSVYLQGPVK